MFCLIRTKSCPRCSGDLSLETDRYGTYLECIQCGANWSEREWGDAIVKKKNEQHQQKLLSNRKHEEPDVENQEPYMPKRP